MADLDGMKLGSYRVLHRIGSGGMGDIYLAEQPELGRNVAIKVVRHDEQSGAIAQMAERNEANRRFAQEARAVAALEHPHILPIYDYGEQGGVHYLAMQYVPDGSLVDLLAPGPLHVLDLPVSPALAADILQQAASALQYAHDRGVVHRDIKPHNLLVRILSRARPDAQQGVSAEGKLRLHILLADFGLARFMVELTGRTGTTGTPLYSAPEQYQGHPVPATDQYALACVAYLLLAGRPPFDGTIAELHHQHLSVSPPPITRANPLLPPALDGVLQRALAKDPTQRFPHILDFGDALRAAVDPTARSQVPVTSSQAPQLAPMPFGTAAQPSWPLAYVAPTYPSTTQQSPTAPQTPLAGPPIAPFVGGNEQGHVSPFGPVGTPAVASSPITFAVPRQGSDLNALSGDPSIPAGPAWVGSAPPVMPAAATWADTVSRAQSTAATPHSRPTGATGSANKIASSAGRQPDGPAVPIPRHVSPRRRYWNRLPLKNRVGIIGLVAVLVLVSIGSVAYTAFERAHPPQPSPLLVGKVARTAVVNMSRLPELAAGTAPQAQSSASLRTIRSDQANVAQADHSAGLPSLAPTLPQNLPSPGDTELQTKFGLGQHEVGITSPMNVTLAASSNAVIEVTDGAIELFGYNGQADGSTIALDSLFQPIMQAKDVLGQPRILFDQESQRWILVASETAVQDSGVSNGYLDIAVSGSAQPVDVWSLYQITAQLGGALACTWADAPQIGVDSAAFYITANSFDCGSSGAFRGASLWDLPKQAFTSGKGSTYYRWSGIFRNAAKQPVSSLSPAVELGSTAEEWLMSNDAGYVDAGKSSKVVIVWGILNSAAVNSGKLPTLVGREVLLPYAYADPPAAVQHGVSTPLTTGDARIAATYYAGGHLYGAFTTAVQWQSDSQTRAGVYWIDIVPQVIQSASGTANAQSHSTQVSASTFTAAEYQANILGFSGGYTFNPALVADAANNVAMIASVSSSDIAPSLIYSHRRASDARSSMGANDGTVPLALGQQPYTSAHWGDYAGACLSAGDAAGTASTVWVAGVYMDDHPPHWQSLVWQMRLQ